MNGIEVTAITGDAAFAVDSDGKIIAWNEAAERSLGYQSSEVVGLRCWRVLKCRNLSSNLNCDKSCPVRNGAFQGEPINRAQMLFGLISRAQMSFRNASGETTQVTTSTFMVQGEAGRREVIHLLQCLSAGDEKTVSSRTNGGGAVAVCPMPRQSPTT
ncbi:MAG: PAS domain S-box protein [Thermoanaerobaculia bacterium]